ncbi:hypothetical protein FNV43_RR08529 [Rhamnella rubrinervis]|uniref:Uncharacterized protein n=1 Tax=Rhamnella rubrinervis TaxID=2594499 RepID=A0A8K0H9I3_9ROSA|nr:hypothetical protein FNV43_RR08529 [Rhamnella rubrinervis]
MLKALGRLLQQNPDHWDSRTQDDRPIQPNDWSYGDDRRPSFGGSKSTWSSSRNPPRGSERLSLGSLVVLLDRRPILFSSKAWKFTQVVVSAFSFSMGFWFPCIAQAVYDPRN